MPNFLIASAIVSSFSCSATSGDCGDPPRMNHDRRKVIGSDQDTSIASLPAQADRQRPCRRCLAPRRTVERVLLVFAAAARIDDEQHCRGQRGEKTTETHGKPPQKDHESAPQRSLRQRCVNAGVGASLLIGLGVPPSIPFGTFSPRPVATLIVTRNAVIADSTRVGEP